VAFAADSVWWGLFGTFFLLHAMLVLPRRLGQARSAALCATYLRHVFRLGGDVWQHGAREP
jgi:hypothetical protein